MENKKVKCVELIYDYYRNPHTIKISSKAICFIQIKDIRKHQEIVDNGKIYCHYTCDLLEIDIYNNKIDKETYKNILNYTNIGAFNIVYDDGTKKVYRLPIDEYLLHDGSYREINTLAKLYFQLNDNITNIRVKRRQ